MNTFSIHHQFKYYAIVRKVILIFLLLPIGLFAELCKTELQGNRANESDNSIITHYTSLLTKTVDTPSIFFMIDNSGSMKNSPIATDSSGNRFNVIRDFIDTLQQSFKKVEVGLSVFGTWLFFDPADSNYFVTCPTVEKGAYIPLLELDKVYPDYNNRTGQQILKGILDTALYTEPNGHRYVDLQYQPTDPTLAEVSTHINACFEAAKHAFNTSINTNKRERQFIIFISDGEATFPQGPTQNDYIQGIGAPTTYTVFFSRSGMVPNPIRTMTENIKMNGYSLTNPSSNFWGFNNTSPDSLMHMLIQNILSGFTPDRTPVLLSQPSPTFNRTPTLQWHVPKIPGSHYIIQIDTLKTFYRPFINENVSDTSFTPQVALPIDSIYWRVKSDISAWSKPNIFEILDNRTPTIIPYEDTTYERQPTLTWHKSSGIVSSYTIQIASVPTFNAVITEAPVADTFYSCQAPLPLGKIYWRVRGDDSEYSKVNTFYIKDKRIPTLIPYQPKITLDTLPQLRWHAVPSATSYTIAIFDTSNTPIVSVPVSDTTYKPTVPLPVGKIYWHVKSNLVETWSKIDRFTIQSTAVPFLIRYNGEKVMTFQPQFKWHPVDSATTYKILLAKNIGFIGATTVPLTDTTYTPVVNLADGTWYWKVSCSINLEAYSPLDSVIIDSNTISIQTTSIGNAQKINMTTMHNAVKITSPAKIIAMHIFDIQGRRIHSLEGKNKNSIVWNYTNRYGTRFSNGMYVFRVLTSNSIYSQRVVIYK